MVKSSLQFCVVGALNTCEEFYLTYCVDDMVLESHLHHKIVNSLFAITGENNKLTILWESLLSLTY